MDLYSSPKEKIDFTKKFPDLFSAVAGEASIVSVPKLTFMVCEGVNHFSNKDSVFAETKTFLEGLAFSMKFQLKRSKNETFEDYMMPPLEAFWSNLQKDKKDWQWRIHLLQPNTITADILRKAVGIAKVKQQDQLLPQVSLVHRKEGEAIQTLHIGGYDGQEQTVDFLRSEAEKRGYFITGDLHEIYLNDIRRTPVNKLHTIIRYKVEKK